jgi:hypothetical protein
MATSPPARKGILLLGIAVGLAAFALGLALAGRFLPEWRDNQPLPERVFRERFGEIAARGGLALGSDEPRVRLVTRSPLENEPFRTLGDEGAGWLLATRTAVRVEVSQPADHPESHRPGRLTIDFSLDGRPYLVVWTNRDLLTMFEVADPLAGVRFAERIAPGLLAPGESLGPARVDNFVNTPSLSLPILGSARPQHLQGLFTATDLILMRRAGAAAAHGSELFQAQLYRISGRFGWGALALLGVLGLFVALAVKSRLGVVNGAALALLSLATLPPSATMQLRSTGLAVLGAAAFALWIFLTWSCAESLLRSTDAGFTTSLDALRAGRLGPRGGRGLLTGFAFGAGLAGLGLALLALAEALPGVWPGTSSFVLPIFHPLGSPVADGVSLAAGVALIFAFALRVVPVRWAAPAAALAAGVALAPLAIHPFLPAALAANAAWAGLLVYVCRRHGLTALITAAVVARLLPLAVFAALHAAWMPAGFAATAGLSAAIVALGFLGLSRSPREEIERLTPPVFVRRLDEQRRRRDEMSLLARMQRGLLPRTLPRLAGWEIAAHSVLATEAGGDLYDFLIDDEGWLWLAAGDVAGHGYSCAIAQAMTKAALASLIRPSRTPAEVLQRSDTVLRAAGAARNFTTLALLRLDPSTGEALFSNAGHPYPLLWAGGETAEITEIAIPSLPLGLGPPRQYRNHALSLPPGAALVFGSDGLFEALDGDAAQYGYERAREVLLNARPRGAERILEALLADWRRHLHGGELLDDTTVVVLRRAERAG